MSYLTAKELSCFQDLLSGEELLIKKFKMLAEATTDAELKAQFTDIANHHQNHYDTIYSQLH
nr:hypothetical protein [uncultured Niameybacter sp.]